MKKGMQRQVDPEVLEQEFKAWKDSEEAKEWEKLLNTKRLVVTEVKQDYAVIDVTLDDFAHGWGPYLEQLRHILQVFKVPSKSPSYDQEKIRSAFFAQSMNEMTIDNRTFTIPKASADSARDTREEFMKIWRALDELESMEAETYKQTRTNLVKCLGTFEKMYAKHVKTAHTEIYNEYLMPILDPLVNVVKANRELYAVENRHHPNKKWFVDPAAEFRIKACRAVFFEAFEIMLKKLRETNALVTIMDVKKCYQDVEMDTSQSLVLKYFLHPLKTAWFTMRGTLKKMHKDTINRIRQPLKKNEELVRNLKDLIKCYDKCEVLLGDDLKKDQLMFVHSIVSHVYLSPLKSKLAIEDVEEEEAEERKKKEETEHKQNSVLTTVIPCIAAFQGLLHMWKAKQLMEERKKQLEDLGETLESIKLPKKHVLFSQDHEDRYEGLPRIWIWEGYIPDSRKPKWEEWAEKVGALNIMVQEDIVDYFITTDLKARQALRDKTGERRPPFIWNYHVYENEYVRPREELKLPSEIQQVKATQVEDVTDVKPLHTYRTITNAMESYVDGRVIKVIEAVEKFATTFKITERDRWEQLLKEVIHTMNKAPPPAGEEEISEDEVLNRHDEPVPLEESKEIEP